MEILRSVVLQNGGVQAGAGAIENGGDLTITESAVRNNFGDITGGIGNSGVLKIVRSSITSNGGGSLVVSELQNSQGGLAIIENTTIVRGMNVEIAAILNEGTVSLLNTTVTTFPLPEGAFPRPLISSFNGAITSIQNSIIAWPAGLGPTCEGSVMSLGHDVIGDPTGCDIALQPTDLTGDPGLGAFIDDGTPGHGHFPLLATSQAIDAGNQAACPKRDQLGEKRHRPCDIGSIEFPRKDR